MTPLLFVYGTLQSRFENRYAQALRSSSVCLGPAIVRGSLWLIQDYPGMTEGSGWVRGEVYRLRNPKGILLVLDRYEGSEYVRRACFATLKGALRVRVQAYLFRGPTTRLRPIRSGIFISPNRTKSR